MSKKFDFVLLIDDDEPTNFLHKLIVEEAAITNNIIAVQKGSEGIDLLKSLLQKTEIFKGLVLVDINMPLMDGWMVIEELENFDAGLLSKMDIYMVSASENPKDFERIRNSSIIKGHMPKPLVAERLIFNV